MRKKKLKIENQFHLRIKNKDLFYMKRCLINWVLNKKFILSQKLNNDFITGNKNHLLIKKLVLSINLML
jgi:hypothetical protein